MESSAGFVLLWLWVKVKMVIWWSKQVGWIKDVNSSDSGQDLKEALSVMFQYGKHDLGLDTEKSFAVTLIQYGKVLLPRAKPETIRITWKNIESATRNPNATIGYPIYSKENGWCRGSLHLLPKNMINLSKARLKLYRSSKNEISVTVSVERAEFSDSSEFRSLCWLF